MASNADQQRHTQPSLAATLDRSFLTPWYVSLLPFLVAVFVYAPALDNGFSLDDYNWLQRTMQGLDEPVDFVAAREPGQLLAPIPRVFLLVWVGTFDTNPLPYHLALLFLHLVNVALVSRVGAHLSGPFGGTLASFLFALTPSFHEAIFWVAAFFHPLTTMLYLSALLAFLTAKRVRSGTGVLFLSAVVLALFSKALAFALLPSLLLYGYLHRNSTRTTKKYSLVAGAVSAGLVVGYLNLRSGILDSYLLDQGYYVLGFHWISNLWSYFALLGFPFPEVTTRLGLSAANRLLFPLGALIVVSFIAASMRAADWRGRWCTGQFLLCLAPVLPFVFEPASRYLYLAAAHFALLVASLSAPWLVRLVASRCRLRRSIVAGAILAAVLASWAELRLVDNHYEYREQQMSQWIEDVSRLLPEGGVPSLTIIGLPTLAIDPGIHLQAALRIRWSRPNFTLHVIEARKKFSPANETSTLVFEGDPSHFGGLPTNPTFRRWVP